MRCLALADALGNSGWSCRFAVSDATPSTIPGLMESGHAIIRIKPEDDEDLGKRLGRADLLVVDSYDLGIAFESAAREWANRILVVDDAPNRVHDCDLLIDQTAGRKDGDYAGHVPDNCKLLLGANYAMLRPQFLGARATARKRRQNLDHIAKVIVSLGASDPQNMTAQVLDGIEKSSFQGEVCVVLSSSAIHLNHVKEKSASLPNRTRVLTDVRDMADLLTTADLAIGAAGVSSWERCCLALPSLVVVLADNQLDVAKSMELAGAASVVSDDLQKVSAAISQKINDALEDPDGYTEMAEAAGALCDGYGTARIVFALMEPELARDGQPVSLRVAEPKDEETIFTWQSDTQIRRYSRNPRVPSRTDHAEWMSRSLDNADRFLCLIEHGDTDVGVLRLDRHDIQSDTWEVSILVDSGKQRLGIGEAALHLARRFIANSRIDAEVLHDNEASHNLFLRAGYVTSDGQHYTNEAAPKIGTPGTVKSRII